MKIIIYLLLIILASSCSTIKPTTPDVLIKLEKSPNEIITLEGQFRGSLALIHGDPKNAQIFATNGSYSCQGKSNNGKFSTNFIKNKVLHIFNIVCDNDITGEIKFNISLSNRGIIHGTGFGVLSDGTKIKIIAGDTVSQITRITKDWSDIEWKTVLVSDLRTKINAGANINATIGTYNSSLLQNAIINNENLEIIKFLIANGADVNYRNKNNATAVYFSAAFNKNPAITTLLIDSGADVNIEDYNNVSALSYAAEKNQSLEIINTLISAGANVNSKDADGETPLHDAVLKYKDTQVINAIISAGSDINAKTNNGESVLHWGIKGNSLEVVKFLVAKGADINTKTNNGESVLHWGIKGNNLEVVKFLIAKGMDINVKTNNGGTLLYWAIYGKNSKIINILISKNIINTNAKDIYLYAGKLERQEHFDKAKKLYMYIINKFSNDNLAIKANDRLISLNEQKRQQLRQKYQQDNLRREKEKQLQKLIKLQEETEQQRKQDLQDAERIRMQDIKNAENKRKEDLQQRKNACIISHNQCVKRCRRHQNYQRENSCNSNCYEIARSSGCT